MSVACFCEAPASGSCPCLSGLVMIGLHHLEKFDDALQRQNMSLAIVPWLLMTRIDPWGMRNPGAPVLTGIDAPAPPDHRIALKICRIVQ